MKVVYNNCYGGFSLSHAGIMRYAKIKGIKLYPFVNDSGPDMLRSDPKPATDAEAEAAWIVHYCTTPEYSNGAYWHDRDIDRGDQALVQVVEEMGKKADGKCARLAIEDVPAGTLWRIDEYDGNESVMTQDSYEWKMAV